MRVCADDLLTSKQLKCALLRQNTALTMLIALIVLFIIFVTAVIIYLIVRQSQQ